MMRRGLLSLLAVLLMGSTAVFAGYPGTTLFSDTYDRDANVDIDVLTVGMGGTLSPLDYVENFEGSGTFNSIQIIDGGILQVATGAGMSSLFLDHNFIDQAILDDSGMSISLDVVAINSVTGDGANRWGGFGVGMTYEEANNAGDIGQSALTMRNGNNPGTIGVADFFLDLSFNDDTGSAFMVRSWHNGVMLGEVNVGTELGTIRADLTFSDFNEGTTVEAIIFFNDEVVDTQTFTWDNTDQNYIGISGRASSNTQLDNYVVSTLYEDRVSAPTPANGEQSLDAESVVLSWAAGLDATGNPNADITNYYVYITEDEPNFAGVSPVTVSAASYDPALTAADSDKLYYWRVDESILSSAPEAAETITGPVWAFDTSTFPIITENGQPDRAVRYPYTHDDYEGPAIFECTFISMSEPTAIWYKVVEGGDVEVTSDGEQQPVAEEDDVYTSTLVINDVTKEKEGLYYCKIYNQSGIENAEDSEAAALGVRRLVAHWTMDEDSVVDGQYVDESGEGHNADPNVAPTSASFKPGVDVEKTAEALDLTVDSQNVADAGRWDPATYTGQFTLSVWIDWNGLNGLYQGIITKREQDNNSLTSWFWEINPQGNVAFSPNIGNGVTAPMPTEEGWYNLVAVQSSEGRFLYINGELADSNGSTGVNVTDATILLAHNNNNAGTLMGILNADLDDVRIYNYGLTQEEVIDLLYHDITGKSICIENPQFDVAGGGDNGDEPDCVVDIADFAAFANHWMESGVYPK